MRCKKLDVVCDCEMCELQKEATALMVRFRCAEIVRDLFYEVFVKNTHQTPYTRSQGESPSPQENGTKGENKQDLAINHLTENTPSGESSKFKCQKCNSPVEWAVDYCKKCGQKQLWGLFG